MTSRTSPSICRVCMNFCPVDVEIVDGVVQRVSGDRTNPIYRGYTCVKGRTQAARYTDPSRLLHTLVRRPDGTYAPIPTDEAIGAIAEKLTGIVDRFGPRSVALFGGTYMAMDSPLNLSMVDAFMTAVGSPLTFTTSTIDQPGKPLAKGFHGAWMAPSQAFDDPDVALLVGNNPFVSHQGRNGAPADFFRGLAARGGRLIVIDPRRTETAKRATLHLQPRPGEDAALLAGMIRVILAEALHDTEFVAENVTGVDALRAVVAPFTPDVVAARADVPAEDVVAAARMFGTAAKGYAAAGTGPNMTAKGTLVEYLLLCLDTLCGHWMRAGDRVRNALSLVPAAIQPDKAQALPPFPAYGYGEQLRVRGLTMTAAGLPTAAMADEILLPGEGQVRAVVSVGGNPAACVPDQLKMVEALRSLDLLVQVDIQMSPTAALADYVIASTLPFEMPGTNLMVDFLPLYANGVGLPESWAHYTPAVVDPPDGSDVIEQWRFLHRLAGRMGLQLGLYPALGEVIHIEGSEPLQLDMTQDPDTDDLLEHIHTGSRIPFTEIKQHPRGALFPDPPVHVRPRDPGWEGRLDVGNAIMLTDLGDELTAPEPEGYPFRLISRRLMHVMNAPTFAAPQTRPRHNPAYLHPADLAGLGVEAGDVVEIRSDRTAILAVAEADDTVRPGTVSISHAFGGLPGEDDADVRRAGSNPGRLVADDGVHDRFSGQPRMSNVPVRIGPAPVDRR
ncbi:oxidoreductase [Pseudonocardia sulfidoxydans NBRC 16205]|uniref:Oxidoreductase n=2 Tax=Pseudonocardia sulfidoxydans TaxID=54011 RepID=A0A511DBU0_9PSEU|nr:molybdopterin-dependent oxidoreductase [Pseudonocardia sulfidoxydans]GEL22265.1 oxidoreductase [Pseudonocardia sulfidoxydans NBRC 16205]